MITTELIYRGRESTDRWVMWAFGPDRHTRINDIVITYEGRWFALEIVLFDPYPGS